MIANYHSHTTRCNHGFGTEREHIEHAIAAGFKILGFSDHAPHLFEAFPDYYSNIRMRMSELEDYCTTILKLKEEYKEQIDIHLGLELEYSPADFEKERRIFADNGIEYFILGQHFVGEEPAAAYSGNVTCSNEIFKNYVDLCISAIETGFFTYIAHPDIINYVGTPDEYEAQMIRLCNRAKELSIPLEINLLGLQRNKQYPSTGFFNIAAKTGNKIILGLDAHKPEAYDKPDTIAAGLRFAEICNVQKNILDTIELKSII